LFYEASFNYYTNTFTTQDPQLGANLFAYGDPVANAALGYTLLGPSQNFTAYQLWGGAFTVNQYGTQVAPYEHREVRSFGGRIDVTKQLQQHEFKIGGEYTQYKVRRYAPGGAFAWYKTAQDNPDPAKLLIALHEGPGGTVGANNYGYDIYGNTIDQENVVNGQVLDFAPMQPVFAAGYIQDKIEFSDIILNLGVRYDYIDPDSWDTPNPSFLHFGPDDLVLKTDYVKTEKTQQLSPRIGFSFPVSDRTVFHAQYGKFIQQTKLNDSYIGAGRLWGLAKAGFYVTDVFGWGLKPTRTTQYEIGFSQQISDFASFDITAFYKDIQDQVQFTYIIPATGSQNANYGAYQNADFATSKGLEFKVIMRRTNRIAAQLNYTLSSAASTGSNPQAVAGIWSAGSVVDYPKYVFPSEFDQSHRGSLLFDYRFARDDGGPILQELGANILLQFNSGHAMTRLDAQQRGPNPTDARFRTPIEPIGASSTPWFFELDARLDKTVRFGGFDMNFYIYVINLLGTDNPVNAFIRSANAKDDGWFATAAGKADLQANGRQYLSAYNAFNLGENSGNFGAPRQIRFGVKLDY
jgi:hypothetical protein